jgi:4-amino-4-deoxy-L-arabinose transferase-like glycosyltransferase
MTAGILILLALARVLLQVFTNGQYGFHQDELVTMDIATRQLAWGYVAWPPVTPFLARVALTLFGLSPIGLRSFAVIAEGLVMLLTGLMIRDLGGGHWAQVLGAVAVATTPNSIVQGGLFQYETFDYLCWVLLALRLLSGGDLPDARGRRRGVVGRTPHPHDQPAMGARLAMDDLDRLERLATAHSCL